MRTMAVLFPVLTLAGASLAQGFNRFEVYPLYPDTGQTGATATSFTDRTPIGVNPGELLCEQSPANHKGIGDDGTACVIRQFVFVWQDQNLATQEQYRIVFRNLLGGTGPGPDPTPNGVIGQTGNFTTPAGTGAGAFQTTITFATPFPTLPCEAGYCYGVGLGAAPGWTGFTDGQSVHGAFYPPNGTAGDNPRSGAPNLAWAVDAGQTNQLRRPAQSTRMSLTVTSPVLNVGGLAPGNTRQPAGTSNYGAGGIYPDVSGIARSDGLDARVFDLARANGITLLLMSYQPGLPGGIPVTGVAGRMWINPNLFFLGSGGINASGQAVVPVAPAGALPASLMGNFLIFQALTVDATLSSVALSNAALVNF